MENQKQELHPKNKHHGRYEFSTLISVCPELATLVKKNKFNIESIDFSNPHAVKILNKALLKYYYDVEWDLPDTYLCPPIPGRADYIHYLADLLPDQKEKVTIIDVGVGANCIYPLLGNKVYGWKFIGLDIDAKAVAHAEELVRLNHLSEQIEIRLQKHPQDIFKGVIQSSDLIDITMCNPPFHVSLKQARVGTERKWKNLKIKTKVLNFGGHGSELWCPGGEVGFITRMIKESVEVKSKWFTTLVSKMANLPAIYEELKKVSAKEIKTIDMGQGQKKSRIVAWYF